MCANLAIVLHIDICVSVLYYDKTEGGQGEVYMISTYVHMFIHSLMGMHAYVVCIYNKIVTYNYIWYICVSCVCVWHFDAFCIYPMRGLLHFAKNFLPSQAQPDNACCMHTTCSILQLSVPDLRNLGTWQMEVFHMFCYRWYRMGPPSYKLVYKPH